MLDLQLGDIVRLSGEITVSIGLPTRRRLAEAIEQGGELPLDLRGGAFFHLRTYVNETPAGPEALYLNPSTSTRYDAWMPTRAIHLAPPSRIMAIELALVAVAQSDGR
ncbi:MAG: hypothetical protein VB138_11450 [Burkholderia sp.]